MRKFPDYLGIPLSLFMASLAILPLSKNYALSFYERACITTLLFFVFFLIINSLNKRRTKT